MCALSVSHKSITIPPICRSQMKSCPLFLHLSVHHSVSFLPPITLPVCYCWLQAYVKFMHIHGTQEIKDQHAHTLTILHAFKCTPHQKNKNNKLIKENTSSSIHPLIRFFCSDPYGDMWKWGWRYWWPVLVDVLTMEVLTGGLLELKSFLCVGFVWINHMTQA